MLKCKQFVCMKPLLARTSHLSTASAKCERCTISYLLCALAKGSYCSVNGDIQFLVVKVQEVL